VREALSLAIDRQAIVTRLLDGAAAPAANLVAPGVFGHVPGRLPIRHDPVRARALLAEAGLADRLSLTVAAPGNRYPGDARIAQAIAAMFERVGVHTRLVVLPISVYLPRARRGEFAVALLGWGSFSGDLALRSLLMTRDAARGYGSWNWSNYSNPAVDQRVEAALGEIDRQRGEALVREAMNIALDEHAVIPLHHLIASWALRPGLRLQARTDEFTFAHQVSRLDKDAGGVQGRGGSAEADR
jgi:peptide/nickel transport system substrate-binding protein